MQKNLLSVLAAVLILSACSTPQTPPPASPTPLPATPIPTQSPTVPAPTDTPQPAIPAERITITTEDNVQLAARLIGNGPTAVLLLHMGGRGASQTDWVPFALKIARQGYTALTLDFRGYGQSEGEDSFDSLQIDAQTAVDYLQEQGFQNIICIGASMGGTACLSAAAQNPLAGVAVITSPMNLDSTGISEEQLSALQIPKLFVCGDTNPQEMPFKDIAVQMHEIAGGPKQLVLYDSSAHGTDLLNGSLGEEFTQLLYDFLSSIP